MQLSNDFIPLTPIRSCQDSIDFSRWLYFVVSRAPGVHAEADEVRRSQRYAILVASESWAASRDEAVRPFESDVH